MRHVILVLLLGGLLGCEGTTSFSAGGDGRSVTSTGNPGADSDAGTGADASVPLDGGLSMDASLPDAGVADAGQEQDAAADDAGPDAGSN